MSTRRIDPLRRYAKLRVWLSENGLSIADVARRIDMDRRNLARSLKLRSCSARTIRRCIEAGIPAELLPELTEAPAYRTEPSGPARGAGKAALADAVALEKLDALGGELDRAVQTRIDQMAERLERRMERRIEESSARLAAALESRLDGWVERMTGQISDSVQSLMSANHERNIETLLTEAKRVFDNFDYLKFQLDSLAASAQGDDIAARVAELTGDEVIRLREQQQAFTRTMQEVSAKQNELVRELRAISGMSDEMKNEFATMRPVLKKIAAHTESLGPLLKSAIQKMTRLKVSGY